MSKFRFSNFGQLKRKDILKDFFLFSIPILALVLLVVFFYYRTFTNSINYVIEQNERQNIELQARSIHNQFHPLLKDIVYISQIDRLMNVPQDELGLDTVVRMGGIFTSFVKRKVVYDQLCFIDGEGN